MKDAKLIAKELSRDLSPEEMQDKSVVAEQISLTVYLK